MTVYLHGGEVTNVFRLAGSDENSASYALGWTLNQSPSYRKLVLQEAFGKRIDPNDAAITLQSHGEDGGYTDIEIRSGQEVHAILEAKLSWNLATINQLSRYVDRLISAGAKHQRLISISAADQIRTHDEGPWPTNRSNIIESTSMPDTEAFDEHYRSLSDEELLKLAAEGGFTAEAEQVLRKELARRNLTFDEAKRHFGPEWLGKAEMGALGVLTFANGERITAQIVGLNEEGDRLSVQVIPSEGFTRKGLPTRRSHRYIPLHRIASFEPQPQLMEQWPFSDPCRHKSSGPRLLLMSTIFLCMTVGSMLLFVLLRGTAYGLQVASLAFYTLFVLFFTFATTGSRGGGNVPGYKFKCPAVEPQIPRLLWRHLICLVALFVLETAGLAVHPHLPDWWNIQDKKGSTPFEIVLLLLGIGLAMAQILTNKSLLNRAHREFSA